MTDYEERYEGNGEDVETFGGGSSPQAGANSHGGGGTGTGTDDFRDSKSHRSSRDYERESSKSRSKDRERTRDKDRDRDRDRDRDGEKSRDRVREKSRDRDRERDRHRDRDRYRERSERRERGRDRDDDDGDHHHRSRDRRRDEIMTEIEKIDVVDVGLVLVQEPNLNVDQGHVLVHAPKAKELVVLTWLPQLLQSWLVLLPLLQCGKFIQKCVVLFCHCAENGCDCVSRLFIQGRISAMVRSLGPPQLFLECSRTCSQWQLASLELFLLCQFKL